MKPLVDRMAFAMEEDVAPDPGHVGFLGPTAVVAGAQSGADSVKEADRARASRIGLADTRLRTRNPSIRYRKGCAPCRHGRSILVARRHGKSIRMVSVPGIGEQPPSTVCCRGEPFWAYSPPIRTDVDPLGRHRQTERPKALARSSKADRVWLCPLAFCVSTATN